ncbi:glycosyltransferase family 2 protein [Candidatus Woesearchaeota archaeon]|nr:glycosyltransferase family 2 protein [Candidatus Woesearchaeota archaeon]
MKLSIIIPVYNEESTFEKLLDQVLKVKLPIEREVIIVEGGSTDKSREIVKKASRRKDVSALFVDGYSGKGFKVRHGLKHASGDIILIQDADLEYNPGEYPHLINPILKGRAKFVLGSRHLEAGTWRIRKFDRSRWHASIVNLGSEATNVFFWMLYHVHLTDPQTMFKVFHKSCLRGVNLKSNEFDLDWEIVCKFVKRGIRPLEVPVSYKARSFEQGKKIRIIRDGLRAFWAIIRFRVFN